jgi:hypothetical protein
VTIIRGRLRWSAILFGAALAATGCNKPESVAAGDDNAPAEEEQAPAPAETAVTPEEATAATPTAEPPADKEENKGAAPNNSEWYPGFWRWDIAKKNYEWENGFWQSKSFIAPKPPPALRREIIGRAPAAGYTWAPGFWRWGGHEYLWVGGHWTHWTEAGRYEGPRWVKVKGRWQWRDTTYARREQVHDKWVHERTVVRHDDHAVVEHHEDQAAERRDHEDAEHKENVDAEKRRHDAAEKHEDKAHDEKTNDEKKREEQEKRR